MPYQRPKNTYDYLWEWFICVLIGFGFLWLINLILSAGFGLTF